MSGQVLLALTDIELFKGMTEEEVDHVTKALAAEIKSDSQLKLRLTGAISDSAAEIIARKTSSSTEVRS